jgi:hypothetical protein
MLDDRRGHDRGHMLARRDGFHVIDTLFRNDLGEIFIGQKRALLQNGARHRDRLIGEFAHHAARRFGKRRKLLGDKRKGFLFDQIGKTHQDIIIDSQQAQD